MVVMEHLKNLYISTVAMLCAVALASCQKELCYEHPHVTGDNRLTVRFDWSPLGGVPSPSMMRLGVFAEGSQPVQIPFTGREGGEVSLNGGTYGLTGFNSDTEVLFTRGASWSEFEVYSQPTELSSTSRVFSGTRTVPQARGTENDEVVFEPDELWTSALASVTVVEGAGQTVTMPMESATTDYTFTVRGVTNLGYVKAVAATLSGMSGSWVPASHRGSDTHCIIPFDMEVRDASSLSGTVCTFGHCPGHTAATAYRHKLVLYAEYTSGEHYYYEYDVTEQMHDGDHVSDGTGNTSVPIVLDGLPLPQPFYNGTGLQPHVGEWQEVRIEMDM